MTFEILAQSYVDSRRIKKLVEADNEFAALQAVAIELEDAGFYPIQATRLEDDV